jgi:hypothetical protein
MKGYTWKSNQYGLTLDNVVAYELVLPNGTTTTVTQETNSELLFGLRGGLNNFVSCSIDDCLSSEPSSIG